MDAPVRALDAALKEQGVEPDRFRPLRAGEMYDVPVV
jgi:hypothetical protein